MKSLAVAGWIVLSVSARMSGAAPTLPSLDLRIQLDQARAIHQQVFGANVESWCLSFAFTNSAFTNGYQELGRPCLRFPGGTGANFFDSTTGFSIPADPGTERCTGLNRRLRAEYGESGFDTRDFYLFAKTTGAAYSLVMNLSTVLLDKNRVWLKQLKASGTEVRHVELGNELDFGNYQAPNGDGACFVNGHRAWLVHLNKLETAHQLGHIESDGHGHTTVTSVLACDQLRPAEDVPPAAALVDRMNTTARPCPPGTVQPIQLPPYSVTRIQLQHAELHGTSWAK